MIISNANSILPSDKYIKYKEKALDALRTLKDGTGRGGEMTGWVWLPEQTDVYELERITALADKIRDEDAALINIGIGGSYLSIRGAVELLGDKSRSLFAGSGFTEKNVENAINKVGNRDFYINVISKSGNTAESMLAFERLRSIAEGKYGENVSGHIICTTGEDTRLCDLARKKGYTHFNIPKNIGGRYSILTAAGLVPMAAAGIDIYKVLRGAREQMQYSLRESEENPSLIYGMTRQYLYDNGKKIEVFAYPGEKMMFFSHWWMQLFGESEGKEGKGIYPSTSQLSSDLHAIGQYIQEGERTLFETVFSFRDELEKNTMLRCLTDGVCMAHYEGGVPIIRLFADRIDEENLGAMFYFFEAACGISAYMQGVNPFDQPGVEKYKAYMRAQLEETRFEKV